MYSGYSHTACRLWAERPPYEESLIIVRGRLGCVTYYARDYARDYARPPTGEFATFWKENVFNIMCGALAYVTYYARDYARDYARPPTGDWDVFLGKAAIFCVKAMV